MSIRLRYSVALGVLSLLCAPLFFWNAASAESAAEIQQQIDEQNTQIAQLNKEIEQYQKQLDATSAKKQTLQSTLDGLNLSLKKLGASISVTKKQITSTQLQIQQLANGIAGKEASIDSGKSGLSESLRRLNETETQSLALQVLAAEDVSTAWEDIDAIQSLQNSINDLIAILGKEKQSLTDTKMATEEKKAELLNQQRALTAQQGSLNATKKAQSELLAQTKSQESAYQNLIAQKQAEKVAFESALFELASKLEYTLDPSKVPPAVQGVLHWPLDNVFVTQQFGKTSVSGRLYASGTHDGIDFRAAVGTPVRASLSGTVAEINQGAAPSCQYGKWVLIRHGNGLSTLYAHLSEISVQKGQTVGTGQIIGYAGSTGYATGPHLHFTVYASDAVSYKQYRCKSGKHVMIPIAPLEAYLNPLNYL